MEKYSSIFDELSINIDPYNILKISIYNNNDTIKEAHKLIRKNTISLEEREIVDISYNMIKTELLRSRYNLLRNRPYKNLQKIKELGYKPQILETNEWLNYLL